MVAILRNDDVDTAGIKNNTRAVVGTTRWNDFTQNGTHKSAGIKNNTRASVGVVCEVAARKGNKHVTLRRGNRDGEGRIHTLCPDVRVYRC